MENKNNDFGLFIKKTPEIQLINYIINNYLIQQINEIKTFMKKKELISEVINIGKHHKYICFVGYTHRYLASMILLLVTLNKARLMHV